MTNRDPRFIILLVIILTMLLVPVTQADDTWTFEEACAGITMENPAPSAECLAVMEAAPLPDHLQIAPDTGTLENYSFWKVTADQPPVFDAPNGTVVRQMSNGFNFINAVDTSVEGWVQSETGEWMQTQHLTYVQPSIHRGLRLDNGLPETVAWALGNMYTAPYPGGPQSAETGRRLYRYNLLHIFATVELDGWRWYLVGPDEWVEQRMVSKSTLVDRPESVSGRWIAIDLYEQSLVAYQDDTPVFTTVISSGLPQWSTNEGLFEVWWRTARDGMSGATGAPDAYALQSVPWTMYFDGDISLHGTYWHDGFGYRRSHGCVNLSVSDSRWLFNWTANAEGPLNEDDNIITYVYVYSSDTYR